MEWNVGIGGPTKKSCEIQSPVGSGERRNLGDQSGLSAWRELGVRASEGATREWGSSPVLDDR